MPAFDDWSARDDLVREALAAGGPEAEAWWRAVDALRVGAPRGGLAAALDLCRRPEPLARALGLDALGQFGGAARPFLEEVLPVLVAGLADEAAVVRRAAAAALGHQHDPRVVAPLAGRRDDPDPDVRRAVAVSLGDYDDPAALEALIALTRDASPAVRDWATFGLGSLAGATTPALVAALVERLGDDDDQTREEAIVGLELRRSEAGVIEALAAALRDARVCRGTLELAGRLGDPRLLPALLQVCVSTDAEGLLLEHAIYACSPETEGDEDGS